MTQPKCRFDAEVCGATYVEAPVVVDGTLVTAPLAARGTGRMAVDVRIFASSAKCPKIVLFLEIIADGPAE